MNKMSTAIHSFANCMLGLCLTLAFWASLATIV